MACIMSANLINIKGAKLQVMKTQKDYQFVALVAASIFTLAQSMQNA